MKLRKIIVLVCTLGLIVSMFTGCGSDDSSSTSGNESDKKGKDEQISITMWHSFTQGGRKDFMDKAAADFEAETGVKVIMEVFPWADFYTKWTTGLAAGNVPDISTGLPSHVAEMIDVGAIVPLNDVIDSMGRDRFYEAPINEFTVDGNNYGIPLYAHSHVMWYRQDLLDAAGLDVPTTWEELAIAAKKLTNAPDVYGVSMPMGKGDFLSTLFLNLYVKSTGETLLTKDGKANLTGEAAIEGIKYWVDIYKTASPESSINFKTMDQATLFYQGKTAFDFNSGFHIGGIASNSPDLLEYLSCAPIPKVNKNDPDRGIVTSNVPVVVWEQSEQKQAAKEFVEFMFDKSRYVDFLHSVPGGMLPVIDDIAKSEEFSSHDTISEFSEEIATISEAVSKGTGIGMEFGPRIEASILTNQGIIENMFQDIVLNGKDIEEAAKEAEDKLNALIGK